MILQTIDDDGPKLSFSGADIRSDISFNGDGYLELSRKLLPHEKSDESELIAFVLATNQSDGLVFWHGQEKNVDGKGQDFISLAGMCVTPITLNNSKILSTNFF